MKLPRFRIEDTYDLLPELKSLGINDILTPDKADFGNMVLRNLVYLSHFDSR